MHLLHSIRSQDHHKTNIFKLLFVNDLKGYSSPVTLSSSYVSFSCGFASSLAFSAHFNVAGQTTKPTQDQNKNRPKASPESPTDDSMLFFEGLRAAFWGTFADRVGAPERAQINIHDHCLRMLIFEGVPTSGHGRSDTFLTSIFAWFEWHTALPNQYGAAGRRFQFQR